MATIGLTHQGVGLLIAAYILLVSLSFVLSAAETSYASLRVTLVRLWAAKGDRRAQRVMKLVDNLPHTINAIVLGDNLVNIVFTSIATFSGYVYRGALGALTFSLVNLLVVFIISEAWPKTLAASNPEEIALRLSGFMKLYMKAMDAPAALFSAIGHRLSRIFPWSGRRKNLTTEERVLYTLELARAEGVITEKQHYIISQTLQLDDIHAEQIMVPVEKTVFVHAGTTVGEAIHVFESSGHRRLPVLKKHEDSYPSGSVVGALSVRDAALLCVKGYEDTPVEEVCEPVVTTSKDAKIIDVLNLMHEKGAYVAVVEDDSKIKGFIFMNDLLATIFGEAKTQRRQKHPLIRQKKDVGDAQSDL